MDVEPFFREVGTAPAFARLKHLLVHRDDTTIIEERPSYLRVEFRTTLFVDDGAFLLDSQQRVIPLPASGTGSGHESKADGRDPSAVAASANIV